MKKWIKHMAEFKNILYAGIVPAVSVILVFCFFIPASSGAELIDRIVAIVNDDVILLSEFRETVTSEKEAGGTASEDTVLNDMIDRILLINEAKKYRVRTSERAGRTEDDNSIMVGEYIDRSIKALIHIPYEDIETYYQSHREQFTDTELVDAREEIEEQLLEMRLKIRLREHIKELRNSAYVRIQLHDKDVLE